MSQTNQQAQTLRYFREYADDWQKKASGDTDDYNLIRHRNATVIDAIASHGQIDHFLDVGCGTGQLAIAAAEEFGLNAHGIDFSEEMIDICNANQEASTANTEFTHASVFEHPAPKTPYGAISALGFIEYISLEQMDEFFSSSASWLKPSGMLLIGSRNRLFNLFSMNDYTRLEMEAGTIDTLLEESIALTSASEPFSQLAPTITKKGQLLPQSTSHPDTGIEVSVRNQYTPGELTGLVEKHGFMAHNIYPVHYHAMPIEVMKRHKKFHVDAATKQAEVGFMDLGMVPQSSTYVLDLRKA